MHLGAYCGLGRWPGAHAAGTHCVLLLFLNPNFERVDAAASTSSTRGCIHCTALMQISASRGRFVCPASSVRVPGVPLKRFVAAFRPRTVYMVSWAPPPHPHSEGYGQAHLMP